jgi:hypothetical protein
MTWHVKWASPLHVVLPIRRSFVFCACHMSDSKALPLYWTSGLVTGRNFHVTNLVCQEICHE